MFVTGTLRASGFYSLSGLLSLNTVLTPRSGAFLAERINRFQVRENYCLDRKVQSITPTSITMELANPVIIAPATSALTPRVMTQLMIGALTNHAKKPKAYPTSQKPNNTTFRPINNYRVLSRQLTVNGVVIVFLHVEVELCRRRHSHKAMRVKLFSLLCAEGAEEIYRRKTVGNRRE